jgi:hypothetical protein
VRICDYRRIYRPAAALETDEARLEASDAASKARLDMFEAFGFKVLTRANISGAMSLRRPVPKGS